MSSIEVVSTTQRIVVATPANVQILAAGPVGPRGYPGEDGAGGGGGDPVDISGKLDKSGDTATDLKIGTLAFLGTVNERPATAPTEGVSMWVFSDNLEAWVAGESEYVSMLPPAPLGIGAIAQKTSPYTLAIGDIGTTLDFVSGGVCNIPLNSTVAVPIGTNYRIYAGDDLTVTPVAGVTCQNSGLIAAGTTADLWKRNTNEWVLAAANVGAPPPATRQPINPVGAWTFAGTGSSHSGTVVGTLAQTAVAGDKILVVASNLSASLPNTVANYDSHVSRNSGNIGTKIMSITATGGETSVSVTNCSRVATLLLRGANGTTPTITNATSNNTGSTVATSLGPLATQGDPIQAEDLTLAVLSCYSAVSSTNFNGQCASGSADAFGADPNQRLTCSVGDYADATNPSVTASWTTSSNAQLLVLNITAGVA